VAVAAVSERQAGQAMAFFAVAIPLVLLPVVAFAIETAVVTARQARLQEVAVQVAEDAASQLDQAAFRRQGMVWLDPDEATTTATREIAAREPGASIDRIDVARDQVTISLRERVPLELAAFLPGAAVVVSAIATARLRLGYESPSSRLPLPTSSF
jgi:hypothetical protein